MAFFATFDNDSYSVQVPKTLQKERYKSINLILRYIAYIFFTSLKFLVKYLNVENIAKTILKALEVSISIFMKDHSIL